MREEGEREREGGRGRREGEGERERERERERLVLLFITDTGSMYGVSLVPTNPLPSTMRAAEWTKTFLSMLQ